MKKELTFQQHKQLLSTLKSRFEQATNRHKGLEWARVRARLEPNAEKLWSLNEMERTDGEPDVVGQDKASGEYLFYDCSAESPKGRRSLCYDNEALASRKEHKPAGSAVDLAANMGIELLTEEAYRELQGFGAFDTKTSNWIKTPARIRSLGGALFAIAATIRFLSITTEQNLIMPPEASVAYKGIVTGKITTNMLTQGLSPAWHRKVNATVGLTKRTLIDVSLPAIYPLQGRHYTGQKL